MTKRRSNRSEKQRTLIAQDAARLMAEHGIRDFQLAKFKAADRLGIQRNSPNLPRNKEIQAALGEYQRLFRADRQPYSLQQLRRTALEVMGDLAAFRPRLVGPVLSGHADVHSPVELHVFAEAPEELAFHLMDRAVDYELGERRLRVTQTRFRDFPVYCFNAGGVRIEATVFAPDGERQAPLSPVDGRPMPRAPSHRLASLLADDDAETCGSGSPPTPAH